MKLSKIYSNRKDIFEPIFFNTNTGVEEQLLNVIFAEALDPLNAEKDLHNLGKSILIELLDFVLLKGASTHHFLIKHKNKFKEFKFYLEIQLNSGKYLTINRNVEENTKISIMLHEQPDQDFSNAEKEDWNHANIAIDNAKSIVDSHLNLEKVKPWDYRQGITYFLRSQQDYNDYFQISKFIKGQDANWKPYIAHILGLDDSLIREKYNIESEIEKLTNEKISLNNDVMFNEDEYDKLNSTIEISTDELNKMALNLDEFNFSEEELKINKILAKDIEINISTKNNYLFNINYDIEQINQSLKNKISFDLKSIKKVYEEASLIFPEDLLNDYESLIEFNKKISKERTTGLGKRLKELEAEKALITSEIKDLGIKRKECLKILNGENSIKKYKALQNEYSNKNATLMNYKNQLSKLKQIIKLGNSINELKSKKIQLETKINESLQNQPETYKNIVKDLSALGKRVFNKPIILSTKTNTSGNLEFNITFKDGESILSNDTSESDGTSYKKILCVLFDLAILRQYAKEGFYHFVYHDGIFETLERRKKDKLLEVIRETVKKYNIQYILTIIETDLPRDEEDNKIYFDENEVILKLSDLGERGRLFKMSEF